MMSGSDWRLAARALPLIPGVDVLVVDTGAPGVQSVFFAYPDSLPDFVANYGTGLPFPGGFDVEPD